MQTFLPLYSFLLGDKYKPAADFLQTRQYLRTRELILHGLRNSTFIIILYLTIKYWYRCCFQRPKINFIFFYLPKSIILTSPSSLISMLWPLTSRCIIKCEWRWASTLKDSRIIWAINISSNASPLRCISLDRWVTDPLLHSYKKMNKDIAL
jgi:hypothetical protein